MQVDLDIIEQGWAALDLAGLIARCGTATLDHLGHDPACFALSVLACDDARIRALNGQFRSKACASNVLSWPTWDLGAPTPGGLPDPPEPGTPDAPGELGDIALAFQTCRNEARAQGKTLHHHATHLVVHSTLHLLGYDHQTDQDAEIMEKTEVLILAQMGIADPYAAQMGDAPTGVALLD